VLEELPHYGGRDERLRDPGRSPCRSRLPDRGVGKIGAVVAVEQDVRDHPVRPLTAEQCLDLSDGARFVELRKA
jgi:hypothetical protein